ncbi:MAG: hypothetical protein FWH22_03365, partial [Fibromonadales bacterium]|nr:hypothetical protein [Fibromonadales bacterium]
MNKALVTVLLTTLVILSSCSSDNGNFSGTTSQGSGWDSKGSDSGSNTVSESGSFTDSRDYKTYKWVKIGSQIWMAENLNYNANGSLCYNNQVSNCATYGRLYNWDMARTACPSGWHLPSNAEWSILKDLVGSPTDTKLKATNGWPSSYSGTADYRFSALPGGTGLSVPN